MVNVRLFQCAMCVAVKNPPPPSKNPGPTTVLQVWYWLIESEKLTNARSAVLLCSACRDIVPFLFYCLHGITIKTRFREGQYRGTVIQTFNIIYLLTFYIS